MSETARPAYPPSSAAFDRGAVIVFAIFIIGGYVDGWAHNHLRDAIETFFTPWHAILYGGFALSAIYIIVPTIRNLRKGYDLLHALPYGYSTSLLGGAIFAVAGVCDMIWHIFLGVETSTDAFMSPPHLALFAASTLVFCGAVRATLHRQATDRRSWAQSGSFIVAVLVVLLQLTFSLQLWLLPGTGTANAAFAPTGAAWSSAVKDLGKRNAVSADVGGLHIDAGKAAAKNEVERPTQFESLLEREGVATIFIYAILLAGVLLFVLKSGRVPLGAFTVIFFFDTLGMSLMRELSLPATFMTAQIVLGLLWGIAADVLYAVFKPAIAASTRLYLYMFFTPAVIVALYFLALQVFGGGTWWVPALPFGSILYAGAFGVLLALVASRWQEA